MKKILLAVSLCASTALLANDADYHWEFTPTVGGVLPEGNTGLKNSFTFGARIAKNLGNDVWLDQIELGYDRVSDFRVKGDDSYKPDLNSYFLNIVKDIYSFNDNFKLYGLLGGGYMDFSGGSDADTGFGQYGLGLKYYVTDNFATKLEVRDATTFDHGDHFMFYNLGFGVDFGKRAENVAPVVVAPIGDEDGDGVPDNIDKCPGTPAGVVVDEFGCEKVIRLNLGVHFAFDSAKVNDAAKKEIDKVTDYLNTTDNYKVLLEGHTDSTGNANYNQKLSERRANSVKNVLVNQGLEADRITTVGYGETQPVATNATKEGRAQNRRVDAKFRK